MKKQESPIVHCSFSANEKSLPAILEESFRFYLIRTLANPKTPDVQYNR